MLRTPKCRPLVEALEDRVTPTGNVLAWVNPAGDLMVQGDRGHNNVGLMRVQEGDARVMRLIGNDTTINFQTGPLDFAGVTRDVRFSLGKGRDVVHLAEVTVARKLVVQGGKGLDALVMNSDTVASGSAPRIRDFEFVKRDGVATLGEIGPQQATPGVMEIKLQQAIAMLGKTGRSEEQYHQAIDETMEAIYTSNLVVLPTLNQTETQTMFNEHLAMVQRAIDALTKHVNTNGVGNGQTKADAAEARNFIQVTREAMEVLAAETVITNPNNPQGSQLLNQDDEGGDFVDTVLGNIFTRQVRSPFFLLPALGAGIDEQVILTDPLAPDEIAIVVKEFQGIKVTVTPRIIPIWVEPWFARRTIVGFTQVWVWEFVPAELIKTISFWNKDDGSGGRQIQVDVQTKLILERQLMHFWRFLPKRITAVG